ncbi:MAG: hypothetical protein JW946_01105 [Candidatus Omnitrophica bacterium]|nr:hypothetical protein [Candidatus Omnitrophota bacterium]
MNLKKFFKLDIHKKIIIFFHQNPSSIDTPRGVSAWINYDRAKVNKALKDLAKVKILDTHKSATATGYSYTTDANIIKEIEKHLHNI